MRKITGALKNYIVDAIKNSARKPLHINGFRALVSHVLLFCFGALLISYR